VSKEIIWNARIAAAVLGTFFAGLLPILLADMPQYQIFMPFSFGVGLALVLVSMLPRRVLNRLANKARQKEGADV